MEIFFKINDDIVSFVEKNYINNFYQSFNLNNVNDIIDMELINICEKYNYGFNLSYFINIF